MTQYVRIQNNEDLVTTWEERPCFGFMSYINEWSSFFTSLPNKDSRKTVTLPDEDEGVWDDDDWDDDFDDDEDERTIPGFAPADLKELHWVVGRGEFDHQHVMEDLAEILKNEMFQRIRLEMIDREYVLVSDLKGAQMDETIVPLCFIRNAFTSSYKVFRDEGFTPYQSCILCSCLFRTKQFGQEKMETWVNTGDNQLFEPSFTTMPNLVAVLKGTHKPRWWQGVWGSTDRGYHSYGNFNTSTEEGEAPIVFPLNARALEGRNEKVRMKSVRANLKAAMFDPETFKPRSICLQDLIAHCQNTDTTAKADNFYSRLKKAVLND